MPDSRRRLEIQRVPGIGSGGLLALIVFYLLQMTYQIIHRLAYYIAAVCPACGVLNGAILDGSQCFTEGHQIFIFRPVCLHNAKLSMKLMDPTSITIENPLEIGSRKSFDLRSSFFECLQQGKPSVPAVTLVGESSICLPSGGSASEAPKRTDNNVIRVWHWVLFLFWTGLLSFAGGWILREIEQQWVSFRANVV